MTRSAKSSASICVVGAGRWGKNHVRTLHSLGLLGGIVDTDPDRLALRAQECGGVPTFSSIEEAAREPFDGFVVATPAHTHSAIASYLIEQGRHVLVEKPIALVAADARRLRDQAREAGVNLMVGHVLLFHPAIRKIRQLLDDDKIGRLQYLYSNRLNLGTVRTEENILWSFAPHDISIFQALIGDQPTQVESRGGIFLQPGVHDTTLTLLRYPNNIVGHIFLSWLHPYKEHRLVVVGSKGMLSFEDSSKDKELLFYEKGIDWVQGEPIARDGPTEVIAYDPGMPLTAELSYFAEHLDGSPLDVASADSAVEVLEILERATASLRGETPKPLGQGHFVHSSSFVDEGAQVGEGTKIWHFCHVQAGARIGENCSLGQNVNVANNVVIGDHVRIQNNVSIYEGVELEDYVFCGPSMVFTNVGRPRSEHPVGKDAYERTLVKRGATIGANATIVCGSTLGTNAFVAAGAVVNRDVPAHAMVAGVPAKQIGWACACGQRLPEPGPKTKCTACERCYALSDGRLESVDP